MQPPKKIIDSHQHVFWHNRNDADLIADMDAHGIERAWLLSWDILPHEDKLSYWHSVLNPLNIRPDGTHEGIPLRDIITARDRYPGRFIAGYSPNPLHVEAPELLRAAVNIHNVRVCGEWKFRLPFDDPRCLNVFKTAGELKVPIVLHLDIPYPLIDGKRTYDPLWYGGTTANLERALQACPETIFIGHALGFWREISGDAATDAHTPLGPVAPGGELYRLFDTYPNLYADISAGSGLHALRRDPAHAARFLQRYQDRLLFGRDYYEQELHEFLQTIDLPQEVWEKIYWQNAEGLVPG